MKSVRRYIDEHRAEILATWTVRAGRARAARGLAEIELRNSMPHYLTSLAAGNGDDRARLESHFDARLRQGFRIEDAVEELVLLGRCIEEVWAPLPRDQQPDPADVQRLHATLHRASAVAVEVFAAHTREDEQTEKHYLRVLQSIASESLHAGTLDPRLREVVQLVMDALGAQSAALAIHLEGRLVTVATAGLEPADGYSVAMDDPSFFASVAEHDEPLAIWDVSTTDLAIPAALRASGVHSLLGVRLASRHGLHGILYVGLAERRSFTARENHRLLSLAQHLVVHLDNAALVAKLSDQIDALQRERAMREHFVSVLAHDLRGPLSSAMIGAQLVAQDAGAHAARHELGVRIERNLDRMDRMIRDLLDVSRIRAGEPLALELADVDLCALVHETCEELRLQYGDRFTVDCDPALRGVWSADQLRRALWNLATNAVKYGDADARITIVVRRDGERARLAVHNEGEPIAVEDRRGLFEPFARTRAAQDSGNTGWGLGLALVRGCAEAHGGGITVASDPSGTTFTIDLPLDARQPAP